MPSKRRVTASLSKKLSRIRLVIMDVDGVLSDGRIIYDSNGIEYKSFDAHDGFGIFRARQNGIKLAIISGRISDVVSIRAKKLKITDVHQGSKDKRVEFDIVRSKYKLLNTQCCFIGDDEFDIPLLEIVGFSAAPANAVDNVKTSVDYVTTAKGGRGAVREILDMILNAQQKL